MASSLKAFCTFCTLCTLCIFFNLCIPSAKGQQTLVVGQKISFRDVQNKYGGGFIPGTVMKDRGATYPFPENRYEIQVDLPGAPIGQSVLIGLEALASPPAKANVDENPLDKLPPPANGGIRQAPIGDIGKIGRFINPNDANRNPAPQKRAPIVPGHDDWGTPPKAGTPFNYAPNMQQDLGRTATTPPGLQPMNVGSPPGDESAVGRWYTHAGGVFTHKNGPLEYDGSQKSLWGNPAVKTLVNIKADGTWAQNDFGRVTTGKWFDVGQNVIRLVNFESGRDWTASVWKGKIEFTDGPQSREGNRY